MTRADQEVAAAGEYWEVDFRFQRTWGENSVQDFTGAIYSKPKNSHSWSARYTT